MGKTQYDEIAKEYSAMMNPTKRYILVPTFIKIIGNARNKTSLDLACGDGFFTRILANSSPKSVIGVDLSKELIKIATEKEKRNPLGIKYLVKDVLKLGLNRKFDLITAVYLFNYAETKKELLEMCKLISKSLSKNGQLSAIIPYPGLKIMKNFEYERRFTNTNQKHFFKDGDKIKCEIHEKGKKLFSFTNTYWSKKTYNECFRKSGFKSIKWVTSVISKEGIQKYGEDYWKKVKTNPSNIGLICKK